MVAPQEDANCHEDVEIEIQNIIDLNQSAFAYENTLQIETKELERCARQDRTVLFFLNQRFFVLTFVYTWEFFSYRNTRLNHVHFIVYLGRKVQWLTFTCCTLLCGFIFAINKLHKLKAMASCSFLYLIILIFL